MNRAAASPASRPPGPRSPAPALGLSQHDFAFRLDGYVEDTTPDQFTFTDQTGVP